LGILIRGPQVLESTRRADVILLDKTATVTTGQLELVDVIPADGVDAATALRFAAAVEHASEHPIARAVAAAAPGPLPPVTPFVAQPGLGASGQVEGHAVVVGRPTAELTADLAAAARAAHDRGQTAVVVSWDGVARAVLTVADTVKATSAEAVARL